MTAVEDWKDRLARASGPAIALNDRLNLSEELLRKRIGMRKVNALVKRFKAEAEADPVLYAELYKQSDPYGWIALRQGLLDAAT